MILFFLFIDLFIDLFIYLFIYLLFQMIGLVEKIFTLCAALTCVYALPIGVLEFHMDQQEHDKVDWYERDNALEQIRKKSERNYDIRNSGRCPTEIKTGGPDVPINERSTCPWYYHVEHDGNRYPTDLLIAVSNCTTCIGSNGDNLCQPITRDITVFVQTVEPSGNVTFVPEVKRIPVGFTCASRIMQPNAATTAAPANLPFTFARRRK